MFKTEVADNIEFAYHDNGPPAGVEGYTTIFIIHGHTYHSGAFLNFLSEGTTNGYRFILLNRRLYPGSTTFTDEEQHTLNSGPFEKRAKVLDKQGEYLAMFIDKTIQENGLKQVVVIGWSLGNVYMAMLIESITRLGSEQQSRLREHLSSFIFWDPPTHVMGFEDPTYSWAPLHDKTLTPEERGPKFGKWVETYFPHPNLASRDPKDLIYRNTDDMQKSFQNLPFDELLKMVSLDAGDKGDTSITGSTAEFRRDSCIRRNKALLDPEVREAWGKPAFWCIYGDQSTWNVVLGAWSLEDLVKSVEDERISLRVKVMKGANHFPMHDNFGLVFSTIVACIKE